MIRVEGVNEGKLYVVFGPDEPTTICGSIQPGDFVKLWAGMYELSSTPGKRKRSEAQAFVRRKARDTSPQKTITIPPVSMYSKKFKLVISPTSVTSNDIRKAMMVKYHIVYCGIYTQNDSVMVYIQNQARMTRRVVNRLLTEMLDIKDVLVYSKVEGVALCESGTLPKHGGRRVSARPRPSPSLALTSRDVTNNQPDNSVNLVINNFFPIEV